MAIYWLATEAVEAMTGTRTIGLNQSRGTKQQLNAAGNATKTPNALVFIWQEARKKCLTSGPAPCTATRFTWRSRHSGESVTKLPEVHLL